MNLFVINRYQGDEEKNTKTSDDHLSVLLKRIEERKNQRTAELQQCDPGKEDDQTEEVMPKKKRKKKKHSRKEDAIITENGSLKAVKDLEQNDDLNRAETPSKEPGEPRTAKEVNDKVRDSLGKAGDFLVLGSESRKRKRVVKRVLPHWLSNPEIISTDLNSGPSLDEMGDFLDSKFIDVLRANGIKNLFPVQAKTISWLIKFSKLRQMDWWPRDVCVSAPTGSGKTLAYVLPVVQDLQSRLVPKVRCLVVLPVQELATQVFKVMSTYATPTSLRVVLISGASSFEQEQSQLVKTTATGKCISRADIVIATPGRLVDHIQKTSGFSLDALRFLVIDEADRATDWLQYLPPPHSLAPPLSIANFHASPIPPAQKLLFSATLSQDPEKLSRLGLFQPMLFTSVLISDRDDDVDLDKEAGNFVGRYTSPNELSERAVECSAEYKPLALFKVLTEKDAVEKTLVFTNSGETAHRLTILLGSFLSDENLKVGEISAQLIPKQREDVLKKFCEGSIQVLVSSDALARGLDIPGVQLVVSYDFPKHINGYVYRAGRTGRAGVQGTAISVLTPNQTGAFKRMLTAAHKVVPTIESMSLEVLAESVNYQTHLEKLKEILEKDRSETLNRLKAAKRKRTKTSGHIASHQ